MDQIIGDWSMVRGNGQTVCGLTLTNTEATADNFQVFLKPKCDPAVAAFAPTQWRLERGQMLLMNARGDTWQLEADDNAQWRRVPDNADPLILVRQSNLAAVILRTRALVRGLQGGPPALWTI